MSKKKMELEKELKFHSNAFSAPVKGIFALCMIMVMISIWVTTTQLLNAPAGSLEELYKPIYQHSLKISLMNVSVYLLIILILSNIFTPKRLFQKRALLIIVACQLVFATYLALNQPPLKNEFFTQWAKDSYGLTLVDFKNYEDCAQTKETLTQLKTPLINCGTKFNMKDENNNLQYVIIEKNNNESRLINADTKEPLKKIISIINNN